MMEKKACYNLSELAEYLKAELRGEPGYEVTGLASLTDAGENDISFLSDPKYSDALLSSKAGVVIVTADQADNVQANALISANPYLGFAKLSRLFDDRPSVPQGIHPSAQVADDAILPDSACIGPNVVIEAAAVIGENVQIGAGCFVGAGSQLGDDSIVAPNVTINHGVRIGARAIIHSATVIGADGFGFANHEGRWEKIAQIGGVSIGDDVEIGANTTIDRGALQDTVIADGVKIDNLVMVAHNVRIGSNTAIAACVGISGSTEVGSNCMIAGGVGLAGHLTVCDGVFITGMTLVTGSITKPGSYSSGTSTMPTSQWRKSSVRFKQLDDLARQIKQLEKEIKQLRNQDQ